MRRSNLKAGPAEKPEPLTYEQFDRLARGIRDSAIEDEWLLGALLLLANEIAEHCHDWVHLDTLATTLQNHLYAVTVDCDRAQEAFIEARRAEFLTGGEK